MAVEYKISLQSEISQASVKNIGKQIEDIASKYKLTLDVNVKDATRTITNQVKRIKEQVEKTPIQVRIDNMTGVSSQEMSKSAKSYEKVWEKSIQKKEATELASIQKAEKQQLASLEKIRREQSVQQSQTFFNDLVGLNNTPKSAKESASAFEELGRKAQESWSSLSDIEKTTIKLNPELMNAGKNTMTFGDMLGEAAQKMAVWALTAQLIYGTLRQIREGVEYVNELDNSLNEIRIVTGQTQSQVEELAKSYNNLAKQMSVTTGEIAKTSVELYRQGLAQEEVEKRLQGIIQYAKISGISLQQSEKIITATANATGESITKIIDIFALLGDETASGADEIGEALQRVASAGENSGLSLEKMSAYITTISSITRESASTIGRSLSSLISRYEQIREKGFNEEDSTKINDVTKALSAVGITATDAAGQLLPIGDVLDELGAKFNTLSKNEQSYVATALFGTYQRNRGITLLRNYNDALDNYETALNSTGTAEQKYQIYLESTQAAVDKTTASWEGFWKASYDAETTKGLLSALSSILDWLSEVGGAIPILAGLIGGVLTASIIGLDAATGKLIITLTAAKTLLFSIPVIIGVVATGLTAATIAMSKNETETDKLRKASERLLEAQINASKAAESRREESEKDLINAEVYINKLEELEKSENTSVSKKEEMAVIVRELNKLIPDLNLVIDENTGKLNKNTVQLHDTIDSLREYYDLQAMGEKSKAAAAALPELETNELRIKTEIETLRKTIKELEDLDKIGTGLNVFQLGALVSSRNELSELEVQLQENKRQQSDYNAVIQAYISESTRSTKATNDQTNSLVNNKKAVQELLKSNMNQVISGYKDIESAMTSLVTLHDMLSEKEYKQADAVKYLMDNYDSLVSAGIDVGQMLSDIDNLGQYVEESFHDQAVAAGLSYAAMTGFTEDYMGVTAKQWETLFTSLSAAYGGDLSNFKSLATEKAKIENELIRILGKNWSQYYKTTSGGIEASMRLIGNAMYSAARRGETEALSSLREQYDTLVAMKNLYSGLDEVSLKLETPSFSAYSSGGKSKSTSKASVFDATEEIIRQYTAEYEKLKAQQDQLEVQKSILDIYEDNTSSLAIQKQLLDNQIKQTEALQKANEGISSEYDKMVKSTRYDISSWFDDNYESTIAYKNLLNSVGKEEQERIQKLFDAAQTYQKAISENNSIITEMMIQNSQTQIDIFKQETEWLDRALRRRYDLLDAQKKLLETNLSLLSSDQDSPEYWEILNDLLSKSTIQMQNLGVAADELQKDFEKLQSGSRFKNMSAWYTENLEMTPRFLQSLSEINKKDQAGLLELWEKGKTILSQINEINTDMASLRVDIIKYNQQIINSARDAEIKSIQDTLKVEQDATKTQIDLLKQSRKAREDDFKLQKQALEDQRDRYKETIDAMKQLLNLEEARRSYEEDVADKEREINKIQSQLALLRLDTSRESLAKQAALEEDLYGLQKDLAGTQRDRYVDLQNEAYDEDYKKYAKSIDNKISLLEKELKAFQDQIDTQTDALEKSIDELSKKAEQDIKDITAQAQSMYLNLVNSTTNLSTSVLGVADSWDTVISKLMTYRTLAEGIPDQYSQYKSGGTQYAYVGKDYLKNGVVQSNNLTIRESASTGARVLGELKKGDKVDVIGTDGYWAKIKIPQYHDGVDSGFVLGNPLSSQAEQFAKLIKGELPVNDAQMKKAIDENIPRYIGGAIGNYSGGVNIIIEKAVNIEGNADKNTIAALNKYKDQLVNGVFEKIKGGFSSRGVSKNSIPAALGH